MKKYIKRCLRNKSLIFLISLSLLSLIVYIVRLNVDSTYENNIVRIHKTDYLLIFSILIFIFSFYLSCKVIEIEDKEKEENVWRYEMKKFEIFGENMEQRQRREDAIQKSILRHQRKIQTR
jgi:hypothetical protein